MKTGLLFSLALVAIPAMADAIWGLEELETAQRAAITAYEKQGGDELAISGFSVKRTAEGNAARAEVYSVSSSGAPSTLKLFCHVHGSEIDCH